MSKMQEIVMRFKKAKKDIHRLAGAKRMATVYVQNQVKKNKKAAILYRAAVKAQLTAAGVKTDW